METILAATIPLSVPLMFGVLGEYVAQRSGGCNLSVEGMMLSGAFFSAWAASATGSPILGLVIGIVAGVVIAWIHGNLSHRLQLNTFVVGLALNILVIGLTKYLLSFANMSIPSTSVLRIPILADIPVIGEPLFAQHWLVYVIPFVAFVIWKAQKTRFGLEVIAAGDDPIAAGLTGIDVNSRRRLTLLWCGVWAGVAGTYLSVYQAGYFSSGMTSGRGYIVIAAVIFGSWTLRGIMGASFVFGGANGLQLALPAIGVAASPQALAAAPYLLAIISLSFLGKSNRQPRALGQPLERTR